MSVEEEEGAGRWVAVGREEQGNTYHRTVYLLQGPPVPDIRI